MPKEKKTFKYVTFTIETSREMELANLEEEVAKVWDEGVELGHVRRTYRKLFVDSYRFGVEKA